MFGIEFPPAKLRAIRTITPPGEVVLYTREWTPIVATFGDAKSYIVSLGITYNLNRDTSSTFLALCAKLWSIAVILWGRQASTMARAIAHNVSNFPQILYSLRFYCFLEKQHEYMTFLFLKLLRVAKGVGIKINSVLDGYMSKVHLKVQEAKMWLFVRCNAEGERPTGRWNASAFASFTARTRAAPWLAPTL
jgi:hypothetical protein